MFEKLELLQLQQYWWVLIAVLGALLVFLLFVQGGQTFLFTLGKTEKEKTMLVNALGMKWEFTFTTLVTFGGAFFASFPLFYSTSFGGAYWIWMIILFSFVIQAVSYEYRKKPNNFLGARVYEIFLFINGSISTVLLGAVVGSFFTGSPFSIDNMNSSTWETSLRGLDAIFNIYSLSLGFAVLFLARITSLLYFTNAIDNEVIQERAKKRLLWNAVLFLVFFLFFVVTLLLSNGFAYDPQTMLVSMEEYKFLHNFLAMPVVLAMFLIGVLLVLWAIAGTLFFNRKKSIWCIGVGQIFVVLSLFFVAAFNNTCYYPSTFDLQSSLNIVNSSSSKYTLTTMAYVSLVIPFVMAYIFYAWRAISKKKITEEQMDDKSEHLY